VTEPSFFDPRSCPPLETFGADPQLVALFTRSMVDLQSSVAGKRDLDGDEAVRALEFWIIHYAIMLFRTSDAARVLMTHNLAREALVNQRHAFESFVRAAFFGSNPQSALNEFRARPLRELKTLDLSKTPHDDAYLRIKAEADAVLAEHPELAKFALPSLETMIETDPTVKAQLYGREYRGPSKLVHGGVESFDLTMPLDATGSRNPSFDSRMPPWWINQVLVSLTSYLAPYPIMVNIVFEQPPDNGPRQAMEELKSIDDRLYSRRNET
jgi:hypothetical protein